MKHTGFIPAHLAHHTKGIGRHGKARESSGLLLKGVVTAVFLPGDPRIATQRSKTKVFLPTVTCNVMIYDPEYVTELRDVPIMKQSAGVVDSEFWVPRPTSINLNGGALTMDGSGPLAVGPIPTQPKDMDGDHVIVGFMANDLAQPIILGQLDHPKNVNTPLVTAVTQHKWKRTIHGWSFGVTTTGNLEVEGVLASAGVVTPTVPPVDTPSPAAGNIDVVLSATAKLALSLLTAESSTREPPVLGTTFLTNLKTQMEAEQTALSAMATAFDGISTGFGALVLTTGILEPARTAAIAAATAGGAAARAQSSAMNLVIAAIETSLASGKPYLSVTSEID